MALSMASGFLFLGGGALTFGSSDGDVAALLIALFPRLPTGPTDNRCHLQVRVVPHTCMCVQTCVQGPAAVQKRRARCLAARGVDPARWACNP